MEDWCATFSCGFLCKILLEVSPLKNLLCWWCPLNITRDDHQRTYEYLLEREKLLLLSCHQSMFRNHLNSFYNCFFAIFCISISNKASRHQRSILWITLSAKCLSLNSLKKSLSFIYPLKQDSRIFISVIYSSSGIAWTTSHCLPSAYLSIPESSRVSYLRRIFQCWSFLFPANKLISLDNKESMKL